VSGRLEDRVEVPLEGVAVGTFGSSVGDGDGLACEGVELFAVAELGAQVRAGQQAVLGVDGEVAAVEEGVDV
jgi:hypothetical protein